MTDQPAPPQRGLTVPEILHNLGIRFEKFQCKHCGWVLAGRVGRKLCSVCKDEQKRVARKVK